MKLVQAVGNLGIRIHYLCKPLSFGNDFAYYVFYAC